MMTKWSLWELGQVLKFETVSRFSCVSGVTDGGSEPLSKRARGHDDTSFTDSLPKALIPHAHTIGILDVNAWIDGVQ